MNEYGYYDKISFDDDELPIRILFNKRLSSSKMPNLHKNLFSWHEQIEILYFRKGGAAVCCGDKTYLTQRDDIVLINPYEPHCVVYSSGDPEYDCLMIDASLYSNVKQTGGEMPYFKLLSGSHIVCFKNHIHHDTELIAHLQALCNEFREKNFAYELAVKSNVFGLFVYLFRRYICNGNTFHQLVQNMERYDRIKPALEYMQKNLSEHISLEDLARICHVSPSHFCRLFRQITDKTPIQYLTELRLYKAAAMLKRSSKNVKEIADESGFEDAGYLSRKFKQQFGVPPMQIKKERGCRFND